MVVELARVAFDHGTGAPETRALHIRHDEATPAASDVAAYALAPTKGKRLTVEADLLFPAQGAFGLVQGNTIRVRARASAGSTRVLGHVRERAVVVPAAGQTVTVLFELSAPKMQAHGVGVHTLVWDWQCQLAPASPWVSFHTTTATIYVTLDLPTLPWTQATDAPSQRRWPWVRMLAYACTWAEGVTLSRGKPAALKLIGKRVERAVYALGTAGTLQYHGSGPDYIPPKKSPAVFKITAFLDDIDSSKQDLEINCTGCAAAVATAVNCLGGDLTLRRVKRQAGALQLNSHVLIGRSHANEGGFRYHDFAIRRHGTSRQVFDATLRPDWDVDATDKTHDYRLAQGRRLGKPELKPKGTAYLQRLLEARVQVQWKDLVMCDLMMPCLGRCDGGAAPDPCIDGLFAESYQQIVQGAPVTPPLLPQPLLIPEIPLQGFQVYHREDNPSWLAELAPLISTSVEFRYVSVSGDPRQFRLAVAWSPTSDAARRALAWLLTSTNAPLSRLVAPGGARLGDAALSSSRGRDAYLVRGNVLAQITSAGGAAAPTTLVARTVDRAILARWSAPQDAKDSAGKSTSPARGS